MSERLLHSQWYREFYVWLLIFFPLAAVIAGFITIVIAIRSDDGLVVDDYYRQGLEINRTLERDTRAQKYELDARLQIAQADDTMRIIITAAADFPYPDTLNVSFLNAARKDRDRQILLTSSGANIYEGDNPQLGRGKWHVLIEAKDWRLLQVIHTN